MSDHLRETLNSLRHLTYDQLINLIVLLELADDDLRSPSHSEKRKGKPKGLYDTDGAERAVASAALGLSSGDRHAIYDMANTLAAALAPRVQLKRDADDKPVARGTVQTKAFTRLRPVLGGDKLEFEEVTYGPYLYIRLWATGGDDRRKRRLKNVYIPGAKELAIAYEQGEISADEILDAYHAGTIQKLVERFSPSSDATENNSSE